MSKKYKGKVCVYCAIEMSTSADHVFAREFFLHERRANLPKVPACSNCNRQKSDLERYLTAVLPIAGNHPDSSTMLDSDVPRRLAKNPALHRMLADGYAPIRPTDDTSLEDRMGVPLEHEKLTSLLELVMRGLVFHHWKVLVPTDHSVRAITINPAYEHILEELFFLDGGAYARGAPGEALFRYEGRQFIDHPALTLWRFQVFGGLEMINDQSSPDTVASNIWACSSPPNLRNILLEPE